MLFLGAFMLLVLPIFLVVCARLTAKSEFGKTVLGLILQAIFYVFAGISVLGLIAIIIRIFTE